jgi:hypothetical protein
LSKFVKLFIALQANYSKFFTNLKKLKMANTPAYLPGVSETKKKELYKAVRPAISFVQLVLRHF